MDRQRSHIDDDASWSKVSDEQTSHKAAADDRCSSWHNTFTMSDGTIVTITAQNQEDSGITTCQILVNGEMLNDSNQPQ